MRDPDGRAPFADQLRRHRRAAGLSQRELARRAGYSPDCVGMLERGVRSPSLASLGPLADALELTEAARLEIQRAVWPTAPEATSAPAVAGDLIGRAAERAAIEAFLGGQSAALVVLGELGIGKTRLLKEAQWLASRRGQLVLFGGARPVPSGAPRPYEPLLTALSELVWSLPARQLRAALRGSEWLVALLPELRERGFDLTRQQVPHVLQRRSVFRAIRRFLTQVSGGQPVLLVLDDLQWASAEALDALQIVLAPPLRIRLLGACRAGEVRADQPLAVLWSELLQQDTLRLLNLEPLPLTASRDLLRKALGESGRFDARALAEAVRRCEGVPLFLHAFARSLRGRADPFSVPQDLGVILRQYLATLTPSAHMVLSAVAASSAPASSASLV